MAPANTPGIRYVAFAVNDIDTVVADLRADGAELVPWPGVGTGVQVAAPRAAVMACAAGSCWP